MRDWIEIPDNSIEPGAPLTADLAEAWTGNVIAVTEGAVGAPRIKQGAFQGCAAGESVLFSALGADAVFTPNASGQYSEVPGSRFRCISNGVVRVSLEIRSDNPGNIAQAFIKKNNIDVYHTTQDTWDFKRFAGDISYSIGDVIHVLIFSAIGNGYPYIRNLQYRSSNNICGGI